MTIDDAREDVGQIRERVDVVQLAILNQGRDGHPVLGASVGTREQRVLPVERNRADGSLGSVVVELDAAVIDGARQPFPAQQCVADEPFRRQHVPIDTGGLQFPVPAERHQAPIRLGAGQSSRQYDPAPSRFLGFGRRH